MPAELSDTLRQIADAYAACTRCADLGVPPDPRREALWELAEATRPACVRVLFLAESPPQRNRRGRPIVPSGLALGSPAWPRAGPPTIARHTRR